VAILEKETERGVLLSYRDHIKAQKKYIRTKKEAMEAKREREQNPRPPRYDPPPAPISPWFVSLVVLILLLPMVTLFVIIPRALVPVQSPLDGLVIWVQGSEEEYLAIKNWLEPEILANGLQWTVAHTVDRYDLVDMLRVGDGDLLIIEETFAQELHHAQALAPVMDKLEGATWDNCFVPFWDSKPFRKTYGWAIPITGSIDDARHLFTVMRQFALPFSS